VWSARTDSVVGSLNCGSGNLNNSSILLDERVLERLKAVMGESKGV
jgi:hypothetical protein